MPPAPPAAGFGVARRSESARPDIAMTPEIDLAIPGSIKTPPTVGMTTIDLLNHGDPEGALLECADGVERGRISLLRRECQSENGSDKERKLCAVHVTALPQR